MFPAFEFWVKLIDLRTVMPPFYGSTYYWFSVCFVCKTLPTLIAFFCDISSFDEPDYLFDLFFTVLKISLSPLLLLLLFSCNLPSLH
jgi:hypothetical protein